MILLDQTSRQRQYLRDWERVSARETHDVSEGVWTEREALMGRAAPFHD